MTASTQQIQTVLQPQLQQSLPGFKQRAACAQLQPWVQLYWSLRIPADSGEVPSHALYPDGGSNLTIEFTAGQLPQAWLQYAPKLTHSQFRAGQQLLSVRFQPTGAFQLLGISPAELTAPQLDLQLANIAGLAQLLDLLADQSDVAAQLNAIECWLLGLAEAVISGQQLVLHSLQLLQQPAADLQHLYQQLPKSRRQYERRFKLETGLSPAQLQLMLKVRLARFILSQNPAAELASVAQQAGFYDQAHLHLHFYRLTGQTPGQYKKRKMSQISNSPC
jgi:AraC-like DNA-binding protein